MMLRRRGNKMANKLSLKDIKTLKPLKRNLYKIRETGKAPINLIRYKKWGLIKVRNIYRTYMGRKVKKDIRLQLTEKGKRILNALENLS